MAILLRTASTQFIVEAFHQPICINIVPYSACASVRDCPGNRIGVPAGRMFVHKNDWHLAEYEHFSLVVGCIFPRRLPAA